MKIRIAVAIDPEGNWTCNGWDEGNDRQKIDNCMMRIPVAAMAKICFIEAEIPLPVVEVIQGKIVP